jgi:hypothetical protein
MKRLSFPLRLVQAFSAQAWDASAYCPLQLLFFPFLKHSSLACWIFSSSSLFLLSLNHERITNEENNRYSIPDHVGI